MGLFKKKTDYSYYSSYSSSRRRLKVGRTVIAVIAAVVVILGIIIYFNYNRIQFLMKGYSWSTTSELVKSFDKVLSLDLLKQEEIKVDDELIKYVEKQIELRLEAKKNKDFLTADKIRDELLEKGISLKDTKEGTTWSKK